MIPRLLCDAEQRAVLDDILSQDLSPCYPDWIVENNAMDGESPVLFAYTCDMPRIKRFDAALKLHGKTGALFCFDFQEDVMRQVCGSKKTRAFCMNMILQSAARKSSLVICDPKSELYEKSSAYLRDQGYTVKVFNLVTPAASDPWNCLSEIEVQELNAIFNVLDISHPAKAPHSILKQSSESVRGGVLYVRLNNGVNAIAHSCYDRRTLGKGDNVSFAVTRLDEEQGDTITYTTYISGKEQDCITLTFTNSKYGSLLVKKVDSITGEPLSDIQFFITTSDGAVVGNGNGYFTTDSAGTILVSDIMPGTTLVVKETRTRPGYILDDMPQTVKIESNETKTLEFRNQPTGSLLSYSSHTTSQFLQSPPAGAACCTETGSCLSRSYIPSAGRQTHPRLPGRDIGRYAAWRPRTKSGCGPSSRWACRRRGRSPSAGPRLPITAPPLSSAPMPPL